MTDTTFEPTRVPSVHSRQRWTVVGALIVAIIAAASGVIYLHVTSTRVYIDTASIQAPLINLAPSKQGVLEEVYVNEGDQVNADATVARVGNELVKAKVSGIIVSVPAPIGAQINPNQVVVTMVDPAQLRVVGEIDEDKGLSRISVGQPVTFTVDAFGGKQYTGVIDEVSPTSQESQIVFNISDQRQVKKFDVKARFNTSAYAELKNGMSARLWVYTQ